MHRRKKQEIHRSHGFLKVEIDFSALHGKLSKIVGNWDFMTALWFDISTSSLEVRVSCWKEKIQEFVFLMHLEDAFHQNLLIKPHNTNTYTHIPIPPQKKTSTHYISEFFVCATFHSCIGSQTSGNRWVKETWIFHRLRSGAWLKSYWKLFHIWRPNRPRCRCLFSWKFPIVDFC